ncbi:hypothetical protein RIF23_04275 [Lipingzhangella sp. LS1_29]|uniref:SH3 domain-containing protein n=1 Tax=Lipingzhangella rawalii TaxID=2055835 RepID=A0ABU2H2J1_9ACTN|nr:hypothetical protein [Lipingzhangella rawalii]MDS1269511.1 hypothetical protein [Lipingzhangella rawalii]
MWTARESALSTPHAAACSRMRRLALVGGALVCAALIAVPAVAMADPSGAPPTTTTQVWCHYAAVPGEHGDTVPVYPGPDVDTGYEGQLTVGDVVYGRADHVTNGFRQLGGFAGTAWAEAELLHHRGHCDTWAEPPP